MLSALVQKRWMIDSWIGFSTLSDFFAEQNGSPGLLALATSRPALPLTDLMDRVLVVDSKSPIEFEYSTCAL